MNLYKVSDTSVTYLVAETISDALRLFSLKEGYEPLKIEKVPAGYVYVDASCVYEDKED